MQDWLTSWVNLGPLLGIVVSFLGFSCAVWQIRRTNNSVVAARIAMESTREEFAKSQAQLNLIRAIERTQELRTLYLESDWTRAHYRYQDVWMTLTAICWQYPNLEDDDRSILQETIERLKENELILEKAVKTGKDPVKSQGHVKLLQDLQTTLGGLSSKLVQRT